VIGLCYPTPDGLMHCIHLCCCCEPPPSAIAGKAAFDVAVKSVEVGLSLIQRLAQAHIDVKVEHVELQQLHKWLTDVQKEVQPLLSLQLRSDTAKTAVQQLLDTTNKALADLEQRAPHLTGRGNAPKQAFVKQLAQSLCRCLTGPSELARYMKVWEVQLRNALQHVKDAGSLQPQVSSTVALPQPCVVNEVAYEELKHMLQEAAGCRAPAGGSPPPQAAAAAAADVQAAPALPGQPRVVQLLGDVGMGKSTLAQKLALDLDREGESAVLTLAGQICTCLFEVKLGYTLNFRAASLLSTRHSRLPTQQAVLWPLHRRFALGWKVL